MKMVSLEEFIKNIEAEIDDPELGALTADIPYKELENWSSMYALIIIAYIDSEFAVTLTGNDLRECNTVTDLYRLIKGRI